jgi:hypothetical protein
MRARLFAGELRALGLVLALALLLFGLAAAAHFGARLMHRLPLLAALVVAALTLSGCAGFIPAAVDLLDAYRAAGCVGGVDITAGAASGAGGHVEAGATAGCPPLGSGPAATSPP